MASDWKCSKCGGINPGKRETCIGCNSPKQIESSIKNLETIVSATRNSEGESSNPDEKISQNINLESPKTDNGFICTLCTKKVLFGDSEIVYTAQSNEQYRSVTNYNYYTDYHRFRVFLCSECKKEKDSLKKAIIKKDVAFGRNSKFDYWKQSDFYMAPIWRDTDSFLIFKDFMKDELYDNVENRNVELIFGSPGNSHYFRNHGLTLFVDDIEVAKYSLNKPFQFSVNTTPGVHKISTAQWKKGIMINATPNNKYEIAKSGNFELSIIRETGLITGPGELSSSNPPIREYTEDWKCPSCGGINPSKKSKCMGCNTIRP